MRRIEGPHRRWVLYSAILVILALPAAAWAADAILGKAGQNTPLSCMDCHGSVPKYPILGARLGYDESGHKNNGNSRYANGGGCQKCHTNEGFIDFVAKGTVNSQAFVDYPSQPGCFTCHAPHETGDLSLRTVAPVTLMNGVKVNFGKGNLCANCHQARQVAAKAVVPTAANKISASWGAHHGPEADILAGTNAFEFAGKSYSSSPHGLILQDGCVQCHLYQPEARYGFSPEIGGHSFNIAGNVHGEEKLNLSSCISCHKDMTQVAGKPIFNIVAKEDYDLDGAKEPVQLEVEGLFQRFVNSAGSGVLQKLKVPLYAADGSWITTTAETVRPLSEMAALYNYKMFLEDRSKGVHNATYTVQVLYDSLQALDPGFDVSRRPK